MTEAAFEPVPSRVDLVAQEERMLEFWREHDVMSKYLHRNDNAEKRHSFIDGPITANNPMGVHHAWGRTYKDLFLRWRTMRGFRQRYQNGFDGQGLWVEVEVEKELGFGSKRDIEDYGVDRFVEACKERVLRFSDRITDQSIRLGYWMDWDDSYHTMSDENNYTIWHFLKHCHEQGWLYKGRDVMPWCPRCGTGLSNMEIATEGYQELTHDSVYLRFPIVDRPGESLLVWTTTPWTLAANTAAAVHPELTYVRARRGDDVIILAKALVGVLQGDPEVIEEISGSELVGLEYSGPFDELPAQEGVTHRVVAWDEVSEEEGTGIVHIAPGCGQEDFALSKVEDLAVLAPIDEDGVYIEGYDFLTGQVAGDVPRQIFESLEARGRLERVQAYTHRYPVCWRCSSELVFRLVDEWFISMDDLRPRMMEITRRIRWVPAFGMERELDWLRNMADWMISKKRYYGLALPIYECDCGHVQVMGSEHELHERAIDGWDEFDGNSPHRPWIDAVKISCSECGGVVSRIEDVGNPWLDAGIVPFSTIGYREDPEQWNEWFPADWISESFPGQFRNWFYSMLAMSAALESTEPFKACFTYALLRDEHGEEMHKSKGNAIWFEDAADHMGSDALRWRFATHTPANNLNFGLGDGESVKRQFLMPLWNVYSFFVTYANVDGWRPGQHDGEIELSELDRWLRSELQQTIRDVTDSLEDWQPQDAARRLEAFVDGLSNWYVRRSRRRFWKSEDDGDKLAAYETLYLALETLLRLLAPFIPFITEAIYQNLVAGKRSGAPVSVHLEDWPEVNEAELDEGLSSDVALVRRMVSLARSARAQAQVKVRQPLAMVVLVPRSEGERSSLERLADQVRDEVNVKTVEVAADASDRLSFSLRPNLPVLGPRLGAEVAELRSALAEADAGAVVSGMRSGQSVTVGRWDLAPGELLVDLDPAAGWAAAQDAGYVALIDSRLTPELESEGLARELVRRLQELRRQAGFEVSDRIHVSFTGDDATRAAFDDNRGYISDETLALSIEEHDAPEGATSAEITVDGHELTLAVLRAAE